MKRLGEAGWAHEFAVKEGGQFDIRFTALGEVRMRQIRVAAELGDIPDTEMRGLLVLALGSRFSGPIPTAVREMFLEGELHPPSPPAA